jgi:RsiW-degrading membrane proteinase PrsW (M82 family)
LSGISLPFLERLDLIFLSIWLVKVTSTLTGYFYGAAKGMGFLFHRNKHDAAVLYLVPIICVMGFFWNSENDILSLTKVLQFESYFIVGLPILLLILAVLTGRKEGKQA